MPHSHPFGKEWAADYYRQAMPKQVFDLGPGAGMWSDALRPVYRSTWYGIEIWEPYVTSYELASKYDSILIADAFDYIMETQLPDKSLVIAGDILEHMPEAKAWELLTALDTQADWVLVSVPIIHYEQGPLEGNPYETHVWHPTHEWVMDVMKPTAFAVGEVVGAYWKDLTDI